MRVRRFLRRKERYLSIVLYKGCVCLEYTVIILFNCRMKKVLVLWFLGCEVVTTVYVSFLVDSLNLNRGATSFILGFLLSQVMSD